MSSVLVRTLVGSVLAGSACIGSPPVPRYLVTELPAHAGTAGPICFAIGTTQQQAWWWQPGPDGCRTRSTGPDVFKAHDAWVRLNANGSGEVRFFVPMHVGPDTVVQIAVFDANTIAVVNGTQHIRLGARDRLEIKDASGGARR